MYLVVDGEEMGLIIPAPTPPDLGVSLLLLVVYGVISPGVRLTWTIRNQFFHQLLQITQGWSQNFFHNQSARLMFIHGATNEQLIKRSMHLVQLSPHTYLLTF